MRLLFKITLNQCFEDVIRSCADIRAVKGVVVGQLLVAVVDFGLMFDTYSRNFRMEEFRALTFVLFAFALGLSSLVGMVEQRLEYYAGTR